MLKRWAAVSMDLFSIECDFLNGDRQRNGNDIGFLCVLFVNDGSDVLFNFFRESWGVGLNSYLESYGSQVLKWHWKTILIEVNCPKTTE